MVKTLLVRDNVFAILYKKEKPLHSILSSKLFENYAWKKGS